MLNKVRIKKLVIEVVPLLIILVGVALVAFSIGPYQSYDTQLEFEAASNVVKTGIPYVKAYGTAIDQPPLGFYIEALFLKIFGMSANTGTALMTLFGLASTVAIYLIAKELYGKSAGFFAAALFGLNPWQLVLSRSFLLDAQCLFFSIICLYVGILAIRNGSGKFALVTGVVFAAALLTKLYAAFVLIPLLLYYIYSRPKLNHIPTRLAAFSIPSLMFAFLWYQIIRSVSILTIFRHNDLTDVVPASTGVVTSPFFVTNFLLNYGLGLYFLVAVTFSLLLGFSLKKYFSKKVVFEGILLVSIVLILGVNVILGAGFKLNVPYFSAIKYCYQTLPFFVLLAASLVAKGFLMVSSAKEKVNSKKILFYLSASAAIILVVASLISSMYYTNELSTHDYLQYRVEPQVNYGYAFLNPTPLTVGSPLMVLQYLGYVIVLSVLLWAFRYEIVWLSKQGNAE